MTDLFVRENESFEDLPVPTISAADASLNFRSYFQTGGWKPMSDDADERTEVWECTLPAWSGITQRCTDYNAPGGFKEIPFRLSSTRNHYTAASLINEWLKQPQNKGTPAAEWILANAEQLNTARRYWDAKRAADKVIQQKLRIKEMQDELRRMEVLANVAIIEVREDRQIVGNERLILAKEFGANDEDLKS